MKGMPTFPSLPSSAQQSKPIPKKNKQIAPQQAVPPTKPQFPVQFPEIPQQIHAKRSKPQPIHPSVSQPPIQQQQMYASTASPMSMYPNMINSIPMQQAVYQTAPQQIAPPQPVQPPTIKFSSNDYFNSEKTRTNKYIQMDQQPPNPLQLLAQPVKILKNQQKINTSYQSSTPQKMTTKAYSFSPQEEVSKKQMKIRAVEDPLEPQKGKMKSEVEQTVARYLMACRGQRIPDEGRSRIRTKPLPEVRFNKIPTELNIIGRGVLPSVHFEIVIK